MVRSGLVVAGLLLAGSCTLAGESPDVQKQIDELKAKVEALEKQKGPAPAAATAPKTGASWTEKVDLFGDILLRFERVEEDSEDDRERGRMRVRVGLKARINDEVDFQFRLATGSDDCPTSCYQTLGDAGSKKAVWVNQAFVDYHPQEAPGLNLLAGKMENPFFCAGKNEMVWGANLTPEGGALKYSTTMWGLKPFVTAGGFWMEERAEGPEAALYGGQAGAKLPLGEDEDFYVLAGGGYFDYTHLKGQPTLWNDANSYGNTVDGGDDYRYDFNEAEIFAELGIKAFKIPAVFFGEFVKNTKAGDEDEAFTAGLCLGRLKDPGDLAFRYEYREVESDAVIGLYSERGADRRGHEFGLSVQAMKNVQFATIFAMDEVGISPDGDEHDYRRLRFNLNFKF